MSRILKFPRPDSKSAIRDEAVHWLIKLDGGKLSEEEQASLKQWLNENPLHQQELQRLAYLWDELRVSSVGTPKRYRKFHRTIIALAASVCFLLLLPFSALFADDPQYQKTNGTYVTDIGEQKRLILSDRSTVVLNTHSILKVAFEKDKRQLILLEGEASFDVAHDKSRPFIVSVNNGSVEALGTSFSVRKSEQSVNVLISQGTVKVDSDLNQLKGADNHSSVVLASAGEQVELDHDVIQNISTAEKALLEKQQSWKNGFLVFENEPLIKVVDELSRYSKSKIIIDDPEINNMRIGGYYPIKNLDVVFSSIEMSLGLIVDYDARGFYLIKKVKV